MAAGPDLGHQHVEVARKALGLMGFALAEENFPCSYAPGEKASFVSRAWSVHGPAWVVVTYYQEQAVFGILLLGLPYWEDAHKELVAAGTSLD